VDRSKRKWFFAQFAFNNFVSHILGEKDRDPTAAEYKEAALKLPGVIAEANPRAIFAFGYAHRKYSKPVISESGIPYVFSVHPVQDKLKQFPPDWHQFVQMFNDLGDQRRARRAGRYAYPFERLERTRDRSARVCGLDQSSCDRVHLPIDGKMAKEKR
jgi:hypothetical protein